VFAQAQLDGQLEDAGMHAREARGVILHSGGLDSSVLLSLLRARTAEAVSLTVLYGQRHEREAQYASTLCLMLGIKHEQINASVLAECMGGSSQTDLAISVPHGFYADASMAQTVVPNRNMTLLSMAIAYCISQGMDYVAYAAHSGDHPIYPDCRPSFIGAMRNAAAFCHTKPIAVLTPFSDVTKADVVSIGTESGVPFSQTYSCYEGGLKHCGECGTCVERILAFHEAGIADPTEYKISNPLANALRLFYSAQGVTLEQEKGGDQ